MNINLTKNKIPSTESLEKHLSLPKELVNPKRDWITLLVILGILLVAVVGFDIYTYRKIVSGDMYISVRKDELVIEVLKKDDLNKIQSVFELKKINIVNQKLENLVDPSI